MAFFGKYDDVVESVSVVASTPVDARRKAKRYILHKHKYLEHLAYCEKIDVNLLFEGVKIIWYATIRTKKPVLHTEKMGNAIVLKECATRLHLVVNFSKLKKSALKN